jgi:hypothetical protein
MWSRIKRTLLRQFSHDVPHGLAACEFGCKVGECSQDKWERCEEYSSRDGQKISIDYPP